MDADGFPWRQAMAEALHAAPAPRPERIDEAAAALAADDPRLPFAEPDAGRPAPALGRDEIARPDGSRLTVTPRVVEFASIVVSHDMDGNVNPAYPVDLQPRDRGAAPSRTWVAERAKTLEPIRLGRAPTAQEGAPIVGPDGVVESGNGRAMIINRAYDRHPDRAAAYRAFLETEGFPTEGMKFPVLVRVRETPIANRAAFAREANVATTAGLSARERAFADAERLDEHLLSLWQRGETSAAANTGFARAFADRIVAAEERPGFVSAENRLSAEGRTRIEAALTARGWGEADIVSALYEASEPTSKAILGAMADTAPIAARLKAAIAEGRVPAEADPTPAIVAAYRLVDRARASGQKLADLVDQVDIETGAVPEPVRAAARLFFREDGYRVAAGRETVATRIERALTVALDRQNALGDLFGAAPDAAAALRGARLVDTDAGELPPPPPPALAPDGTAGAITPEIGAAIGREAAPIRLREGNHDPGTGKGTGRIHIEARHGEEIRAAGYADVDAFVAEVASQFTDIYAGAGRELFLVKRNGRARIAVIELQGAGGGASEWSVATAALYRPDYFENRKVLWQRPGPASSPPDGEAPFNPGNQSSEKIGAPAPEHKPPGDPAIAAAAQSAIDETGDTGIILPADAGDDVSRASARAAMIETEEDAAAQGELAACLGGTLPKETP